MMLVGTDRYALIRSISARVGNYCAQHLTPRVVLLDLAICAFALGVAVALFWAPGVTPDWPRFSAQAQSMLTGSGFRTAGELETYLPPGYPVFVAIVRLLDYEANLRAMQLALLLSSVGLVYGALAQISRRIALPLAVLFALNPLTARLSGFLLSETLGVFLCALACFLLVTSVKRKSAFAAFFLGAVCVALLLTSPAAIFLAFAIWTIAALALVLGRRGLPMLLLVVGAVTIMMPWQLHCARATGSICYFVYSLDPLKSALQRTDGSDLVHQWLRTWSLGERHIHVLHRNNPGASPDWAFTRPSDKDVFPPGDVEHVSQLSPEQQRVLWEDLESKSSQSRVIGLTVVRSMTLWLDMRQNAHAQMDYVFPFGLVRVFAADDAGRAAMRLTKVGFSTLVYLLYIAIPVLFVAAMWSALRSRSVVVPAVFLSVLAYTLITAYTAHNEERRNAVFLPAMVLAIGLGMQKRRGDSLSRSSLVSAVRNLA